MFIYSPQDNIITEFIKMTPSKVYIPLNLNNLCSFLYDPRLSFCFVIVVHESLVGPEQFNSSTFFGFPAYLNPLQQCLYDFDIHIFIWRTIGGLIHNYYIR